MWATVETDTETQSRIAAAIASAGGGDFYRRLLDLASGLAPKHLLSLVRYSRFSPPALVFPGEYAADLLQRYRETYYVFDPFYSYWRETARPGVVHLAALVEDGFWTSRYAREFLHDSRISDEISVFMPPLGGTSVGIIVDRQRGRFKPAEIARFERGFGLLAALHDNHVRLTLVQGPAADPEGLFGDRPLRVVDSSGTELMATLAWRKAIAAMPIPPLRGGGRNQQVRLPDSRTLHRLVLPEGFYAAPGGMIDQIETLDHTVLDPAKAGLPPHLERMLTARERDIVALTLQGHPISGIAARLGLGAGTVKNHRRRIYAKLDITTERELFLAFNRGWQRPDEAG